MKGLGDSYGEDTFLVILSGTEDYFIHSALKNIRSRIKAKYPGTEQVKIDAAHYQKYTLNEALGPSLFSTAKLVEAENVAAANEDFAIDAIAYFKQISSPDMLVLHHAGGNKNKKILDAAKKSGAKVIDCKPLTRERDKQDFVRAQFRKSGVSITQDAVIGLTNALGTDVSGLAAAVAQLIEDIKNENPDAPGVTAATVDKYYGGRVEATAFKVAEAAMSGTTAQALSNFRFAVSTGVDLVPLVAVLAMRARTLVRVASYSGASAAKDLGLAPWQVEQARRILKMWTPWGLANGVQALAHADAQVKGGGENPEYAVERAIVALTEARQQHR